VRADEAYSANIINYSSFLAIFYLQNKNKIVFSNKFQIPFKDGGEIRFYFCNAKDLCYERRFLCESRRKPNSELVLFIINQLQVLEGIKTKIS